MDGPAVPESALSSLNLKGLSSDAVIHDVEDLEVGSATVKKLSLSIDSRGILVSGVGALSGSQPLTLKFAEISLNLNLNKGVLAKISLTGIEITKDNPVFNINLAILPSLDPKDVLIVTEAAGKIASGRLDGASAGISDLSIKSADNQVIGFLDVILSGVEVTIICAFRNTKSLYRCTYRYYLFKSI